MSAATTRIPEIIIKLPRFASTAFGGGAMLGSLYKFRCEKGVLNVIFTSTMSASTLQERV